MSKVAVVFWSSTGNTEAMAEAVAQGVKNAGSEADLINCNDFSSAKVADYDAFAFGCPSMGAEQLEDTEFEPMWDEVKTNLGDKKVVLFGSYGWGEGEWMQDWEQQCKDLGLNLAHDFVICNETPDDDGIAACQELGKSLA